jgi:hypothetical protein
MHYALTSSRDMVTLAKKKRHGGSLYSVVHVIGVRQVVILRETRKQETS